MANDDAERLSFVQFEGDVAEDLKIMNSPKTHYLEYSVLPPVQKSVENVRVITFQPDTTLLNRHPKNHLYVLKDTATPEKTFQIEESDSICVHDLSMKKNIEIIDLEIQQETIPLKCPNCLFITFSADLLTQHLCQRHKNNVKDVPNEFGCRGCSNKFTNVNSYKAHLQYDHQVSSTELRSFLKDVLVKKQPLILPKPVINFKEPFHEVVEVKEKKEEKIYKCSEKHCNTRMKSLENIQFHMKCHANSEFSCPEADCGETFGRWNPLRGHLWRKHKIDMELHACDQCDYKTFSLSSLNNIHRRIHNENKPFLCDICAKAFKNPKQLRAHKTIHRPTHKMCKFICEICNRPFSSRRLLRLHNEGVHQQLKKFLCNFCGYKANSKSAVQLHERRHTGQKPYQCTLCNYATSDHNSLRRHKLKHTREYAYTCPYCDYACIQSSTFKIHLRSKHPNEEGIMTFSCKFCNYKSLRRNNYLTHMAKHDVGKEVPQAEISVMESTLLPTDSKIDLYSLPMLIHGEHCLINGFEDANRI